MKKFSRFCGTMILTMGVVGVVLVGIGVKTVGWNKIAQIVEDASNGTIHFKDGFYFEGESLSEIGKYIEMNAKFNINDASMFDKSEKVWQGDVNKIKIADSEIRDLDLEVGGSYLCIEQSDDNAYYVEYEGAGKSQAYAKGNDLYIKVMNTSDLDFSEKENCFTVYVPKDAKLENVKIELGAGVMKLDGLRADEMKIEIGAGQIVASDLATDDMKLSIGAGDMNLQSAKLGETKIEVGAGNCTIQGAISDDIKAECSMGNITLKLEGREEDFDYELECVSGNLVVGDSEYSGLSDSTEVDNGASQKMDLQCVMGNIEVVFE